MAPAALQIEKGGGEVTGSSERSQRRLDIDGGVRTQSITGTGLGRM